MGRCALKRREHEHYSGEGTENFGNIGASVYSRAKVIIEVSVPGATLGMFLFNENINKSGYITLIRVKPTGYMLK